MGTVTETIRIEAPVGAVWAVLADFGGIAAWNPQLKASRLLGTPNGGVGAVRQCDIKVGGYVKERVVDWRPDQSYTWEVFESDTPMARATNRFALQADGRGTLATMHLDYALKGGPLGKLLDALVANRKMHEAARETLGGLKKRAEGPATGGSSAASPAAGAARSPAQR